METRHAFFQNNKRRGKRPEPDGHGHDGSRSVIQVTIRVRGLLGRPRARAREGRWATKAIAMRARRDEQSARRNRAGISFSKARGSGPVPPSFLSWGPDAGPTWRGQGRGGESLGRRARGPAGRLGGARSGQARVIPDIEDNLVQRWLFTGFWSCQRHW